MNKDKKCFILLQILFYYKLIDIHYNNRNFFTFWLYPWRVNLFEVPQIWFAKKSLQKIFVSICMKRNFFLKGQCQIFEDWQILRHHGHFPGVLLHSSCSTAGSRYQINLSFFLSLPWCLALSLRLSVCLSLSLSLFNIFFCGRISQKAKNQSYILDVFIFKISQFSAIL